MQSTPHTYTTTQKEPPVLHTVTEEVFFPKGLIGFYDYQRFLLHQYEDGHYMMLESIDDPDVRFLLCALDWDFYPTEDLVKALISESLNEIDEKIYAIVRCNDGKAPTLNLRAPLVKQDNNMWQVVMKDSYPLDYTLE